MSAANALIATKCRTTKSARVVVAAAVVVVMAAEGRQIASSAHRAWFLSAADALTAPRFRTTQAVMRLGAVDNKTWILYFVYLYCTSTVPRGSKQLHGTSRCERARSLSAGAGTSRCGLRSLNSNS